ncbi:MAG: electron transport complex protein RnfA [Planctomycetota bacterium]|jgi:electron transport complex protein RnfA
MSIGQILVVTLGAIFVNNFVLMRFLGICPFIGVSRRTSDAIGMGGAVLFVMLIASAVTWPIQRYVLEAKLNAADASVNLGYLQTVVFILVIASLVQFVEIVLQRFLPALYESLGIYLPLITTNCAILGVCIISINENFGFITTLFHAVGAAVGFTLALVLMAGIRERLDTADVPKSLEGAPIAFIVAGLMGIAFLGFSGMM